MPYILNKTNGAKITIVDDAVVDTTTDLSFIGRNYNGYGEVFNENFLRLLENFSNNTPTPKPISGQTWYNNSSDVKKLNVFDGMQFKTIANLHVSTTFPNYPTAGDMWWDKEESKLKIWDGSTYKIIGPSSSDKASIRVINEDIEGSLQPVLETFFGENAKIVLSDTVFVPNIISGLNGVDKFPVVKKGITLYGADSVTGSTKNSGYYFWGTAAESLVATTATSNLITLSSSNQNFYMPFVNTTTGSVSFFANTGITYNPSTNTLNATLFNGVATSSRYADLAERYETDNVYDEGTVVVLGGIKEITITHHHADTAVAGVISKNPGYMMNSEAGTDSSHPYVALRGRVPCKVLGAVKKGSLLVTSSYPGYAEVSKAGDNPNAVFAKSLEDYLGPKGLIEVLII